MPTRKRTRTKERVAATVQARVPAELEQAVANHSDRLGVSFSEAVRDLLTGGLLLSRRQWWSPRARDLQNEGAVVKTFAVETRDEADATADVLLPGIDDDDREAFIEDALSGTLTIVALVEEFEAIHRLTANEGAE